MYEQIDDFIRVHRRRWSPQTAKRYAWFLHDLAGFMDLCGLPSEPKSVTIQVLEEWLSDHRWAASTQHTAISACRAFFGWAVGAKRSPAHKIKPPRRSTPPQRTLSRTKVRSLLAALDTSTTKGIRDTAIICLMLDTGLRAAEVCGLRLDQTDIAERSLVVRAKGGVWRQAVYSAYTAACIAEWVMTREMIADRDTVELFCGIGGKRPGSAMTRDGLRAIFRQLGVKAGFHLSPHDLRRTFATMALRSGAPTRIVQIAGGWSSVKMVERYSQALEARDFEPYSPVNSVMGISRVEGRDDSEESPVRKDRDQ